MAKQPFVSCKSAASDVNAVWSNVVCAFTELHDAFQEPTGTHRAEKSKVLETKRLPFVGGLTHRAERRESQWPDTDSRLLTEVNSLEFVHFPVKMFY